MPWKAAQPQGGVLHRWGLKGMELLSGGQARSELAKEAPLSHAMHEVQHRGADLSCTTQVTLHASGIVASGIVVLWHLRWMQR